MFDSSKMRIAALIAVLSVVGGLSFMAFQGIDRAPQARLSTPTEPELVDSSTNQLEGVPTGDEAPAQDPRTGASPDEFLIEFMKKLNEVNTYVYTNEFDSAVAIDSVYQELWAWGESNDLRIRAVLSQEAVDAGNTEFQPQPAPFLELQTADGMQYCAADVSLFDPSRDTDEPLSQALMAGSCADFFAKVKPAE
jgi:hypothetical protein